MVWPEPVATEYTKITYNIHNEHISSRLQWHIRTHIEYVNSINAIAPVLSSEHCVNWHPFQNCVDYAHCSTTATYIRIHFKIRHCFDFDMDGAIFCAEHVENVFGVVGLFLVSSSSSSSLILFHGWKSCWIRIFADVKCEIKLLCVKCVRGDDACWAYAKLNISNVFQRCWRVDKTIRKFIQS